MTRPETTLAATVLSAKEIDDDGEAERLVEEAIAAARRHPAADKADIANALLHLADVQERRTDFGRAEATRREAHRLFLRTYGREHPQTRHAKLSIAHLLRRTGQTHRALMAYRVVCPVRSERPVWLSLVIEEIEREVGETRRADRTLDDALEGLRRDHGGDAMTTTSTLIQAAQRLALRSRRLEAQAVLDEAIASVEEVIAGRRMSMSARIPSQVLAELRAARETLGGIGG